MFLNDPLPKSTKEIADALPNLTYLLFGKQQFVSLVESGWGEAGLFWEVSLCIIKFVTS